MATAQSSSPGAPSSACPPSGDVSNAKRNSHGGGGRGRGPSLTSLFDSACATDGDAAAFLLATDDGGGGGSSLSSVGFTELREASVSIACELVHRHGLVANRGQGRRRRGDAALREKGVAGVTSGVAATDREYAEAGGFACASEEGGSSSAAAAVTHGKESLSEPPLHPNNMCNDLPSTVLVVSTHPSPGESAAVLACARLRVPFVPIDLIGPNRAGSRRLRTVLDDVRPVCAIIVVDEGDLLGGDEPKAEDPDGGNANNGSGAGNGAAAAASAAADADDNEGEEEEDDFLTSPAPGTTVTTNGTLDDHPAVRILESTGRGLHRNVLVSSRGGTLLNGLGLSDLALPDPVLVETEETLRDVLYVLYTSGSTAAGGGSGGSGSGASMGKAVVQTHCGLLNRIRWQWSTFPFVQQMRRELGPVETSDLLRGDGLLPPQQRPTAPRGDVVVRRTPLPFVDSMAEIFGTLLAGVPLYCPSPKMLESQGLPGILADAERAGATRITLLPSQLGQCLRLFGSGQGRQGQKGAAEGKFDDDVRWPWPSLNLAIISGEPCPPTLPSLWERTVCDDSSDASEPIPRKVLLNLFGQTETSGDVLCMVVAIGGGRSSSGSGSGGVGRVDSPLARFPLAAQYLFRKHGRTTPKTGGGDWWWFGGGESKSGDAETEDEGGDGLARCLRWTVPCGLPIAGHSLCIEPPAGSDIDGQLTSITGPNGGASVVGRLYVAGPGVALGYLKRADENFTKFKCIEHNQQGSEVDKERMEKTWFDTSDLAYRDHDTGIYYILGRAPDDNDRDDDVGNIIGRSSANGLSMMGKVNGVMVHTTEIEAVFVDAFREVVRQKTDASSTCLFDRDFLVSVVAVLYNLSGEATKTAVFVDLSSSPAVRQTMLGHVVQPSPPRLISAAKAEPVLRETKSLLLDRDDGGREFACHPSLVPQAIHFVTCLPIKGAAGKVDRSELVRMATEGAGGDIQDGSSPSLMDNSPLSMIRKVFADVLCRDSEPASWFKEHLSFVEMGGDSLTAIEATHKLNREARIVHASADRDGASRLSETSSSIVLSALDVMILPVEQLCTILKGEELADSTRRHATKETLGRGDQTLCSGDDDLRRLGDSVLVSGPRGRSLEQTPRKMNIAWKCPLLMCVDAPALVVRHASVDGSDAAIIGSQGGDILCVEVESGRVLYRRRLPGKIEGGMATLDVECSSEGPRRFVFACTHAVPIPGESSCRGGLHAFTLSNATSSSSNGRKRRLDSDDDFLSPVWSRLVQGELKGAPACFKLAGSSTSQDTMQTLERFGVLVAGYDGVARYFDALTGQEVAMCDDLGGALHAGPSIFYHATDGLCALLASSTWTGRVTCVQLDSQSMTKLWSVDVWAPIYAAPFVCNYGAPLAFFGAVDGAVRCVDLKNEGKEVWKTYTREQKPIFSGCCSIETAAHERCVVVGSHDGSVSCIRVKDGSTRWAFDAAESAILGTPASVGDRIIFATTAGTVIALNKDNGKAEERLEDCLEGEVFSPSIVDLHSKSVFVGCRDNFLYKIRAFKCNN